MMDFNLIFLYQIIDYFNMVYTIMYAMIICGVDDVVIFDGLKPTAIFSVDTFM